MIPPLVRLPTTNLDHAGLDVLARSAEVLSVDRVALVGCQLDPAGHALDEFVVASAIRARRPRARLGVLVRIGEGREPSIVAREATALQLLGACEVVVLEGDESRCRDAALVIEALFTGGEHTVITPTTHVERARNLPGPDVVGGPPVLFIADGTLRRLADGGDGGSAIVGEIVAASPSDLPAPVDGNLVELALSTGPPSLLAAALAT